MNNFEKTFFKRYISEWLTVKWIIHEHWIKIFNKLIIILGLFVFIPSFLMYNSVFFQREINFIYFEIYLFIIYFKIIYDIFDWYNDVWIITEEWVTDLDWALLKISSVSVKYENIEWIWVEQDWLWDKLLNKWDVIIHKVWSEEFRLVDAKVPYKALNEIEAISWALKEKAENQKAEAEKTKFELVLEALWQVVEKHLDDEWLDKNKFLSKRKTIQEKTEKKDFSEKVVLEEGTIDLR
jgi:hypothetical protein